MVKIPILLKTQTYVKHMILKIKSWLPTYRQGHSSIDTDS